MAASVSHFVSDEGQTSQQKQPIELRKEKEGRGECSITVQENLEVDRSIMVKENLEVGRLRNSSSVSIFIVPNILIPDTVKREAYVPKRVPLGPYHHSEKLPPMEEYKARAVGRMTTRFKHVRNLANDPDCIMEFFDGATEEIVKLHKGIRDSYEEKINCGDEALAFMLSLDGCFILEILTLSGDSLPGSSHFYEPLFEGDKIFYTGKDILEDILKLENQIPLKILLELLKLELNSTNIDHVKIKLFEMLCPPLPHRRRSLFSLLYPFNYEKDQNLCSSWPPDEEVHHLLGFMHRFIVSHHSDNGDPRAGNNARGDIANSHNGYTTLPTQDNARGDMAYSHNGYTSPAVAKRDGKGDVAYDHIHRAMSLANAGIKFQPCDGGIANIKFDEKSATLFLPPITIGDSTETLFRNLIAFEMCKPSLFNYVSRYVCLMNQLIDSEGDVALLRKKGIITNDLGNDGEVAKLFNGLCKGVTVNLGEGRQLLGALHSTSPNHVANTTELVRHLPDLLVDVSWWVRDLNSLYCCTSRVSLSLFCNMGSSPFAFLFGAGSCSESSAGGCALCRQRWCMPASIVEQMWSDSVGLRMLCWFRALSLMLLLRPAVDAFGSCDRHSLLLHCEIALLDCSMLWGDVDGFVPSTGLQKYHDFKGFPNCGRLWLSVRSYIDVFLCIWRGVFTSW